MCGACWGQLSVEVPEMVPRDTMGSIYVETESKFLTVRVRKSLFERVEVIEAKPDGDKRRFVFTGPPGKYAVEVIAFDPDTGILEEFATVPIIGETSPGEPGEPGDPGQPDDPDPPSPPLFAELTEVVKKTLPNIEDRDKAGTQKLLREAYELAIESINDSMTVDEAKELTVDLSGDALQDRVDTLSNWRVLLTAVGTQMGQLGGFESISNYKQALAAVVEGLR